MCLLPGKNQYSNYHFLCLTATTRFYLIKVVYCLIFPQVLKKTIARIFMKNNHTSYKYCNFKAICGNQNISKR